MNIRSFSQDDLEDVVELTKKLEESIAVILEENEQGIALSALTSATIRCVLVQCDTLDEAKIHKNIFMQMFDFSMQNMKFDPKEKDPNSL